MGAAGNMSGKDALKVMIESLALPSGNGATVRFGNRRESVMCSFESVLLTPAAVI